MLWALLNIVQCVLIRSKVFGALVAGRIIAGKVLSCCLRLQLQSIRRIVQRTVQWGILQSTYPQDANMSDTHHNFALAQWAVGASNTP